MSLTSGRAFTGFSRIQLGVMAFPQSGQLVDGVLRSVFLCVSSEWNHAPKCTRMQVIYSQLRRQHSSKVHETFENIVID